MAGGLRLMLLSKPHLTLAGKPGDFVLNRQAAPRLRANALRFFSRLFNIRPIEWPRLLLLYAMFFVFVLGWTWAAIILESEFLRQLGVAALPWFFIAKALAAVPVIAIYTAFADQVPNARLLIGILLGSAAAIGVGLLLLGWHLVRVAYPLLYLILFVPLDDIYAAHWYTYVNDFYDTRAAKRLVPILVTAVGTGGIVAGLTMPVLNRYLPPGLILAIWLATLLIVALLAWSEPRLFRRQVAAGQATRGSDGAGGVSASKARRSYTGNIRDGYRYVAGSPFLRWLAVAAILIMVLLACLQYQVGRIFIAELTTVQNMANFIGRLTGLTYLILLPIQLFVLSRVIGRIGVGNAILIYPSGNLAISAALIAAPGLPTAAMGYFSRTNFYGTIGYTVESLLYNAVPLRVKARARAFIGGLMVPAGSLLGGMLLLLLPVNLLWFVPAMIAVAAVGYFGTMLVIRRLYGQALVQMLEQEDFSFALTQGAAQTAQWPMVDPAILAQLRKRLEESTSREFTIFMAKLIAQTGGSAAIPILGQAVRATAEARTRAGLVEVLVASDARGDLVRQLYTDLLADPDGRVRQLALTGLEQLASPNDAQFVTLALRMVEDTDIDVRVSALSLLQRSGNFDQLGPAARILDELLADPDPARRAHGIRVLGQQGQEVLQRLLTFLLDPADEPRLEAALAVEQVSRRSLPTPACDQIRAGMAGLAHDPVERIRHAALEVLGRLGTGDHFTHRILIDALGDDSAQIRAMAADELVRIGKSVIPTVHAQLNSADPQVRKMVSVILSRISRREFGGLINANITGNLLVIYRNHGLAQALTTFRQYVSIAVLQRALAEQNVQLVDEIFYLLSAIHEPIAVKIINESLRSDSARTRVNAFEALESVTTPQMAGLIAPLFEPDGDSAQLLALGQEAWGMQVLDAPGALHQLIAAPSDAWLRTIATFSLGEIGADIRSRNGNGNGVGVPAENPMTVVTTAEISALVMQALGDPVADVHQAAQAAERIMAGPRVESVDRQKEVGLLSAIERVIFLREVPFFEGMTIDQLRVLATVCEEEMFPADARIYSEGDPGGALYLVVSGRVAIEQEKRKGSFARLATVEAHSYFGEMNLFDNSLRSAAATAIQDTLILRLRREPLVALVRQHPDLSLELINVLSQRLREANDRIADLTRTKPRELHKLYDQFG